MSAVASPSLKTLAALAGLLGFVLIAPLAQAEEHDVVQKALPASPMAVKLGPAGSPSTPPIMTPLPEPGGLPLTGSLEERLLAEELPEPVLLPMVYQAVIAGDEKLLQAALAAGYSVNEPAPDGDTPLCAAVWASNEKLVKALLEHGADYSRRGGEGQKPVALAALKRNRGVMAALLDAGADANTKFDPPVQDSLVATVLIDDLRHHLRADRGVTALMACAARGDVENAVTLMQHKADPDVSTHRYSRYALDFAAEQQYLFLMRVLLGRPADSEPDLLVTVDLHKQRAWIEKNGIVIDTTIISTGREGYGTPPGRYVVTDKHREWTSTLYKASMPWFMRLNCGAIGLHAGYVTGHPESHGCIRLPEEKARAWFKIVGVGDEVQIVE